MNRCFIGHNMDTMRALVAQGVKVQMCVTSPPYCGLRDYGIEPVEWEAVTFSPMPGLPSMTVPAMTAVHGLEPDIWSYVAHEVAIFRLVRELLADDGVCWVNLGDTYISGGGKGGQGKHGQMADRSVVHARNGRGGRLASPKHASSEASAYCGPNRFQHHGLKTKDLAAIPWRVALAMQADGWWLRQDIIWHKPNPMPESVTDRCTKAHEYLFLLSKSERYYWNAETMREKAVAADIGAMDGGAQKLPTGDNANDGRNFRSKADSFKRDGSKRAAVIPGQTVGTHRAEREESTYDTFTRNRRSVWTIATRPYKGAHFATFPPALVEPCILAGSRPGDLVFDPFFGSGTTGEVAQRLGRQWIGCEANPAYKPLQDRRTEQIGLALA